jgi:hypothetical protein
MKCLKINKLKKRLQDEGCVTGDIKLERAKAELNYLSKLYSNCDNNLEMAESRAAIANAIAKTEAENPLEL